MSVFGMICEFNPLHNGHQYLLKKAREMGAETVVCVMSGNTTQRGEFAVADQYLRAEAAVRCGADLVLELPFPWCSASAETFAKGGIEVLRHFADTVLFGSECGDLAALQKAAAIAADPTFREEYKQALSEGEQAARAYHSALQKHGIPALSSNDILGVAYLRAAIEFNANLHFRTVQRKGSSYMQNHVEQDRFPSALSIRKLWSEDHFFEAEPFLPPACTELYRKAAEDGLLTDERELDAFWLSFFRLHDGDTLASCAGAEGGLAHRICSMARQSTTTTELMERIKTKRYTDAHLRRTMLYCLADIHAEDLDTLPCYTTLLAANERGTNLLAAKRKSDEFPVITKPADAPQNTIQYHATEKINSIFTLATPTKRPAIAMLIHKPYLHLLN